MLQHAPSNSYECRVAPDRAITELHLRLASLNQRRFAPSLPIADWASDFADRARLMQVEHRFLEEERRAVLERAAAVPREPEAFIQWFEALRETGPGQSDPLFPWLADNASLDQIRWFLAQEIGGEAGFDDLVALTQMRMAIGPKLELARNYWDEMGRGNAKGMHGPMLSKLAAALQLEPRPEATVWESLALANVMAGLAADRRYAFHSIGALGVIELTAPGRSAQVAAGLKRLGVAAQDRHYFDLHAVLDVKHSAAWNREVIRPLVAAEPAVASAIAEGALMRLTCGARCFERYRSEFEL
ncbi:MAG: hypothetical protein JWO51_795 [Rhodospirillales bacterium]|nr:hypothetical protein [Rhodospirillales bacterium]